MHISKKKIWSAAVFVLMFALLLSMTVFAADGEAAQPKMYATPGGGHCIGFDYERSL